jgi:hypothetical protein
MKTIASPRPRVKIGEAATRRQAASPIGHTAGRGRTKLAGREARAASRAAPVRPAPRRVRRRRPAGRSGRAIEGGALEPCAVLVGGEEQTSSRASSSPTWSSSAAADIARERIAPVERPTEATGADRCDVPGNVCSHGQSPAWKSADPTVRAAHAAPFSSSITCTTTTWPSRSGSVSSPWGRSRDRVVLG